MDSIELLFAAAVVIVIAMGAFAIAFLLRRASGLIKTSKTAQADIMERYEKSVELQQQALDATRESIALQRETNRLLTELLAQRAIGGEKPEAAPLPAAAAPEAAAEPHAAPEPAAPSEPGSAPEAKE